MPITARTYTSAREVAQDILGLLGPRSSDGHGWACPLCEKETGEGGHRRFHHFNDGDELRFHCRQADVYHDWQTLVVAQDYLEEIHQINAVLDGCTWEQVFTEFLSLVGSRKTVKRSEAGSRDVWTEDKVLGYAAAPGAAEQWATLGYDWETISHFKLGIAAGRMTVPVPVGEGSYIRRTRRIGSDTSTPKYMWPSGLDPVLWLVEQPHPGFLKTDTLTITEGETSLLALWQMGFSPVATGMGGAGTWRDAWSLHLLEQGYRTFDIVSDNDDPGRRLPPLIMSAFKNVCKKAGVKYGDLTFRIARWPEDAPDKYDPRDILNDKDNPRSHVERLFTVEVWSYGRRHPVLDEEVPADDIIAAQQAEYNKCIDLDVLRGDGPQSLKQAILDHMQEHKEWLSDTRAQARADCPDDTEAQRQYVKEQPRPILRLKTAPGSGKSYTAVRVIEELGSAHMRKRQREAENRIDTLCDKPSLTEPEQKELERLKAGRWSRLFAIYAGPFKAGFQDITDHAGVPHFDSFWLNFKARSDDSAGDMCLWKEKVTEVVGKGYSAMRTLCIENKGFCPFQRECAYMKQFDDYRLYPAVYGRHQHLDMEALTVDARLLVVDEDPTGGYLEPDRVSTTDLRKYEPVDTPFPDLLPKLRTYIRCTVDALKTWDVDNGVRATGVELCTLFTDEYNRVALGAQSAREFAQSVLPILQYLYDWTPDGEGALEEAPNRRVTGFLLALAHELRIDADNWNSRLMVHNQTAFIYRVHPYQLNPRTAVVILDATGADMVYERAFNTTDPHVVDYMVRNPKTKTVGITGSEFTMRSMLEGIKDIARDRAMPPTINLREVPDFDKPISVFKQREGEVQADEVLAVEDFPNHALYAATRLLLSLARKHGEITFVTYKAARCWMEAYVLEHWPGYWRAINWIHFGAVAGLNILKESNAILSVGTPRPNPVAFEAMQRAMLARDDAPLDTGVVFAYLSYHCQPQWQYEGAVPRDSRVESMHDAAVAGTLWQAVTRIRPHTYPHGKHVYIATSYPVARWYTDIMTYGDLQATLIPNEYAGMVTTVEEYLARTPKSKPTIEVFRTLFEVGNYKARQMQRAYKDYKAAEKANIDTPLTDTE